MGGLSAEAPDYPQFLNFVTGVSGGQVNTTINGKVAAPLLLELASIGEDDGDYNKMIESIRLKDTLQDLTHVNSSGTTRNLLPRCLFLIFQLYLLGGARVVIPLAASKRILYVLQKNHFSGRAMTNLAPITSTGWG